MLAPRQTFAEILYQPSSVGSGYGYEDWHWISLVLAAGGEMLIAPRTCKFIRYKKTGSLLAAHDVRQALLRPTEFLEPRYFLKSIGSSSERRTAVELSPASASPKRKFEIKSWLKDTPQRISRITESYPVVQKSLGYVYRLYVGPEGIKRESIPESVFEQWQAMASLEPQLDPTAELLEKMAWYTHPRDLAAEAYERICRKLAECHFDVEQPQFTHVYLDSPTRRGGEASRAIKYILLTASNPAHRILVIDTEGTDYPWKEQLPPAVHWIDIGQEIQGLMKSKRSHLFAQILIQLQPQVIHLLDSKLGNQAFELYGRALAQISRLFKTPANVNLDTEVMSAGLELTELSEYAEYLTAVLLENQRSYDYLEETFAFDPAKMFVYDVSVRTEEGTNTGQGILWEQFAVHLNSLPGYLTAPCHLDRVEFSVL